MRERAWRPAGALLLLLALAGGPPSAPAAEPARERIVTAGGAVTEIVFALGAGDRVVGTDSSSVHPDAARELPKIGYFRNLAAEGILSLGPTLVLATGKAGPKPALAQVRSAGVRVVLVPDEPTEAALADKIRTVGAAIGREREAATLAATTIAALRAARVPAGTDGTAPRVMFVMSAGPGAPLVAGRDTVADTMIALAGGRNAVAGFTGYKPVSPEAIAVAAPEVLLATSETVASAGGREALLRVPTLAATPAARTGRLVAYDALPLLGFGPRTGDAVAALARAFAAAP